MSVQYVKSFSVVAYSYRADIYCPTCIIEQMIRDGIAAPAARDMATEDALWQCSQAMGIDNSDEYSFDSDEFPKVVFADQTEDDSCGECGEVLA